MASDLSTEILKDFESIRHADGELEYWFGRELMPVLGYSKWQNLLELIRKAAISCRNSGATIDDHFRKIERIVAIGSGAKRPTDDFLLTRFACYLIAQNGDPRKPEIAVAQNYFAVQTRRQELQVIRDAEDKRLESRKKLRDTERKIESTVYTRGIQSSVEFATFKNKHVEALYGGISVKRLKSKRNIPKDRALADFDTDVELKAKDFALAMTDHNIKQKNLHGKPILEEEVEANSKAARSALLQRGIVPEHLGPEEDLKVIEQRRKNEGALTERRGSKKLPS